MLKFHCGAPRLARVAFMCLAVSLASQSLRAQTNQGPIGTNVAVIDISTVFDHHQRFQAAIADIKKDIKAYEGVIKAERDKITSLSEQAKNFDPNSPEYKRLEEQAAQMVANLQVQQGLKKKSFMEREAKLYYHAYKEVSEQIADFANRYRIGLVLRYNSKDIDPAERNSVIQGVNRPVVYQSRLDITRDIIDRLNRGTAPENLGAAGQTPRPR